MPQGAKDGAHRISPFMTNRSIADFALRPLFSYLCKLAIAAPLPWLYDN
jgi:hypothetical protein